VVETGSFAGIRGHSSYYFTVLIIVIFVSSVCVWRLQNLKFDYDFEAFFPNEDNELGLYNKYRETFEFDNEFVLVGVENKAGIFKKDFFLRVDSLTKELSSLKYVRKVTSPTNLKITSLGGLVPVQTSVLHIEDESLYREDSLNIYRSPYLSGSFFPTEGNSLTIYIKTVDLLSKRKSDTLAKSISRVVGKFHFDDVHIAGRIFAQKVYLENIQREFLLFLSLSFVIVVIFLWFSFRTLYGVIVPMAIVLLSILWTLGIMDFFGKPLDIMSTMLPTMVFIAGMSDVVHFFSKYFEELARGTERKKIYPLILREVGFPTFLTLITTVVGFLSLLFSSIKPIREFGIYTSVGVVIAFVLTYTLLPALLYFFTPQKLVSAHGSNNKPNKLMRSGLFWIFRNQKTILVVTTLLIILSVIGMSRVRVNHILLEDLNDKVRVKQDFNFFDKHYSGLRPVEIQVTLKNKDLSIWDYRVLSELHKLDDFIRKEYKAGFLLSPSSFVKELYRNSTGDDKTEFPDQEDCEAITKYLRSHKRNAEIKRMVTPDGQMTRISAKIKDIGSMEVEEHNKKLLEFIAGNIDKKILKFDITGAAHLIDRNNDYMVANMTQGFVFSIIVIGILTFFLHRSWRMVFVFILPNVIPLLIIAGIMGFAGIELKAASSLVFSIAFGIATDDTIHFISRLKIELGYGKSLMYAFKRTYFETGKPIILTTLILIGGFMSLMTSNFESTWYFGFLICITIIIAVLADIFLLPVLLFLIYRRN
jgi:predicted RND superfamily exporter protein